MRIQHNILAMNAYRNYNTNTSALAKNLEKLSSGYKINRAGDDAAGLAISEKMRAQITGLNAAQKNVKDGISLVKTAEGAMQEIQDMLNRMDYLATQSANGTYDNEVDRANLQKEVEALKSEINRIADSANFNGIKLLDGDTAMSKSISALGALDKSAMIDGTAPSEAGKAVVTVTLGAGADPKPAVVGKQIAADEDATLTFDGTDPINGTSASATFEVDTGTNTKLGVTTGNGSQVTITAGTTTVEDLADAKNAAGTKVSDVYDITVEKDATKASASINVANTAGTTKTTVGGVALDGTKTVGDLANATGVKDVYDVTVTGKGSFTATVDFTVGGETKIGGTTLSATTKVDDLAALATDYDITVTNSTGTAKTGTATLAATDIITFTEKKASGKTQTELNNDAGNLIENGGTSTTTAGTAKTGATAIATGDKITLTAKTAGTEANDALNGTTLITNAVDKAVTAGAAASTVTGWDATDVINAGDKITLTAKTPGADANQSAFAGGFISGQAGTITTTNGTNQGAAPAGTEANYKFTLDTKKLQGGQTIKFGANTITIDTASTGASTSTKAVIGGKDAKGQVVEILNAIKAGNNTVYDDTFTGANNNNFTITDKGDGVFEITMTAKANSKEAGNLGTFHVTTADGNSPIDVLEYNKYVDPATATTDKIAQVTYTDESLQAAKLTAGSTLKIGENIEIKIVATDADVKNANEISVETLTDTGGDAKLEQLIEKQAGFDIGQVDYDGTNGTLTFITDESGSGKLDALKEKTAITVATAGAAPTTPAQKGTTITSEGGLEIEFGETSVADLKNKTVTVNGTEVNLGDVFDIKVGTKGDNDKIGAGDEIVFTAKQTGKLDENLMKAVTFTTAGDPVSTEKKEGWDEGQTAAGKNTHYGITIDPAGLAGGQSFTFGNVNGKSYTFEISYDPNATKNDTIGATDKTEITGRELINLSNVDPEDGAAVAEAIRSAVAAKMTDFNVKITENGGKFELDVDAKNGTAETNLGGVRFSSESTGLSAGEYTPFNDYDKGTEGTHAQVSYAFDPSKLKAGDKLTIGDKTIYVGEKTETTKNEDGDVETITLSEKDAQNASTLIGAFESAGFQKGQLKISDKKLTITDGMQTGRTAEELAKELNVSLTSSTRALTKDGLTLQIGDTSDNYNKLTVSIGDMHTKALGIDGINISDQTGASDAIQVIKDAINQVSSVRGDLGATQNRLEHTANNLSVMAENIQDAESTIRDTDIAEEMMAYTKNNILVQSAQAMLAQANAVPQGVLQLLG